MPIGTELRIRLPVGDGPSVRAERLLKSYLTPAQLAQYEATRSFGVIGGTTGRRYKINRGRMFNIDDLSTGGQICFGPHDMLPLPLADVMLAQKIALENDEENVLAVANRGKPEQWRPTPDWVAVGLAHNERNA